MTKNGEDTLLSEEENCADLVEPPTEIEKNHAITGNMSNLMIVVCLTIFHRMQHLTDCPQMKAVKRFKQAVMRRRPELMQSMFSPGSRVVSPPKSMRHDYKLRPSKSIDVHDRKPLMTSLATEGIHHDFDVSDQGTVTPTKMKPSVKESEQSSQEGDDHTPTKVKSPGRHAQEAEAATHQPSVHRVKSDSSPSRSATLEDKARGHAHDPLDDTLILGIGAGTFDSTQPSSLPPEEATAGLILNTIADTASAPEAEATNVISESPSAVDIDVYEAAYKQEIARIYDDRGKSATMFLTRRVESKDEIRKHEGIIDHSHGQTQSPGSAGGGGGLAGLAGALGRKAKEEKGRSGLAALVKKAKEDADKDVADDQQEKGAKTRQGEGVADDAKKEDQGDGAKSERKEVKAKAELDKQQLEDTAEKGRATT